jgi:Ni2+-binding GTPase involved in maturation of urease and hydrogenase
MHHKIKLIIGFPGSGKTFLAKNMMLAFHNPLFLCGRSKFDLYNPFLFSDVEDSTDLIVFDDVPEKKLHHLIVLCSDLLCINKSGEKPYVRTPPQIVITTSYFPIENLDASIKRRISVIETDIKQDITGDRIFNATKIDLSAEAYNVE